MRIISLMLITSPHNPRIKYILSLRERRTRDRLGLMLVEGYDELSVALSAGSRPTELFYCPVLFRNPEQVTLLDRVGDAILVEVSERVFGRIAYRQSPDGWLAIFPQLEANLEHLSLPAVPLILVAEAVEKPGNLGAILRTADAAGIDAVISADPVADWANPNVVRSSKGAVLTVPIASASSGEVINWLREQQVAVVAAAPGGRTPYYAADFTLAVAIVVGAEHQGLSAEWLAAASAIVEVPMVGLVNSLNVSVTAAILTYEAVAQRKRAQVVAGKAGGARTVADGSPAG
jgi:TrmH family RNA methyltransferase